MDLYNSTIECCDSKCKTLKNKSKTSVKNQGECLTSSQESRSSSIKEKRRYEEAITKSLVKTTLYSYNIITNKVSGTVQQQHVAANNNNNSISKLEIEIIERIVNKLYVAYQNLSPFVDELIRSAVVCNVRDDGTGDTLCTITQEQYNGALKASNLIKEINNEVAESDEKMGLFKGVYFPIIGFIASTTQHPIYKSIEDISCGSTSNSNVFIQKELVEQFVDLYNLAEVALKDLHIIRIKNEDEAGPAPEPKPQLQSISSTENVSTATLLERLEKEYQSLSETVRMLKSVIQETSASIGDLRKMETSQQDARKSRSDTVFTKTEESKKVTDVFGARRCILECLVELAQVRKYLKNVDNNEEPNMIASKIKLSRCTENNCARQNIPHIHAKLNGIPIVVKLNKVPRELKKNATRCEEKNLSFKKNSKKTKAKSHSRKSERKNTTSESHCSLPYVVSWQSLPRTDTKHLRKKHYSNTFIRTKTASQMSRLKTYTKPKSKTQKTVSYSASLTALRFDHANLLDAKNSSANYKKSGLFYSKSQNYPVFDTTYNEASNRPYKFFETNYISRESNENVNPKDPPYNTAKRKINNWLKYCKEFLPWCPQSIEVRVIELGPRDVSDTDLPAAMSRKKNDSQTSNQDARERKKSKFYNYPEDPDVAHGSTSKTVDKKPPDVFKMPSKTVNIMRLSIGGGNNKLRLEPWAPFVTSDISLPRLHEPKKNSSESHNMPNQTASTSTKTPDVLTYQHVVRKPSPIDEGTNTGKSVPNVSNHTQTYNPCKDAGNNPMPSWGGLENEALNTSSLRKTNDEIDPRLLPFILGKLIFASESQLNPAREANLRQANFEVPQKGPRSVVNASTSCHDANVNDSLPYVPSMTVSHKSLQCVCSQKSTGTQPTTLVPELSPLPHCKQACGKREAKLDEGSHNKLSSNIQTKRATTCNRPKMNCTPHKQFQYKQPPQIVMNCSNNCTYCSDEKTSNSSIQSGQNQNRLQSALNYCNCSHLCQVPKPFSPPNPRTENKQPLNSTSCNRHAANTKNSSNASSKTNHNDTNSSNKTKNHPSRNSKVLYYIVQHRHKPHEIFRIEDFSFKKSEKHHRKTCIDSSTQYAPAVDEEKKKIELLIRSPGVFEGTMSQKQEYLMNKQNDHFYQQQSHCIRSKTLTLSRSRNCVGNQMEKINYQDAKENIGDNSVCRTEGLSDLNTTPKDGRNLKKSTARDSFELDDKLGLTDNYTLQVSSEKGNDVTVYKVQVEAKFGDHLINKGDGLNISLKDKFENNLYQERTVTKSSKTKDNEKAMKDEKEEKCFGRTIGVNTEKSIISCSLLPKRASTNSIRLKYVSNEMNLSNSSKLPSESSSSSKNSLRHNYSNKSSLMHEDSLYTFPSSSNANCGSVTNHDNTTSPNVVIEGNVKEIIIAKNTSSKYSIMMSHLQDNCTCAPSSTSGSVSGSTQTSMDHLLYETKQVPTLFNRSTQAPPVIYRNSYLISDYYKTPVSALTTISNSEIAKDLRFKTVRDKEYNIYRSSCSLYDFSYIKPSRSIDTTQGGRSKTSTTCSLQPQRNNIGIETRKFGEQFNAVNRAVNINDSHKTIKKGTDGTFRSRYSNNALSDGNDNGIVGATRSRLFACRKSSPFLLETAHHLNSSIFLIPPDYEENEFFVYTTRSLASDRSGESSDDSSAAIGNLSICNQNEVEYIYGVDTDTEFKQLNCKHSDCQMEKMFSEMERRFLPLQPVISVQSVSKMPHQLDFHFEESSNNSSTNQLTAISSTNESYFSPRGSQKNSSLKVSARQSTANINNKSEIENVQQSALVALIKKEIGDCSDGDSNQKSSNSGETIITKQAIAEKNKENVCWALTKIQTRCDGTQDIEILETSLEPPGHFLLPSTNSVILLPKHRSVYSKCKSVDHKQQF